MAPVQHPGAHPSPRLWMPSPAGADSVRVSMGSVTSAQARASLGFVGSQGGTEDASKSCNLPHRAHLQDMAGALHIA